MKILVACECSGRVRQSFQEAGHSAWSCDIKPSEMGERKWHFQADVREILARYALQFDMMIAHPDCTYLTNSGVRWLHTEEGRREKLRKAVEFYLYLWGQPIPRVCIENPVMHGHAKALLGTLPARQFVEPWWFGEPMFKRTGFSLRGLPPLVPTNKLVPPPKGSDEWKKWSWVHRCPPGPQRSTIRARTPWGIARAMAAQWSVL
jgi:hypothetical protein